MTQEEREQETELMYLNQWIKMSYAIAFLHQSPLCDRVLAIYACGSVTTSWANEASSVPTTGVHK